MKVHGKSPPPSGSGYESDDSTTTTGTTTSNSHITSSTTSNSNNNNNNINNNNNASNNTQVPQGQTNINVSRDCPINTSLAPSTAHNSIPHTTNLSEWYVCQSSSGMPTPPSNEHSPIPPITGSIIHSSAVY